MHQRFSAIFQTEGRSSPDVALAHALNISVY